MSFALCDCEILGFALCECAICAMATEIANSTGPARVHGKPPGFPSAVSTYLVCKDALEVLNFIIEVFGGADVCKMMNKDNQTLKHAHVVIDGCAIMMGEASAEHPPTPSMVHLYVEDVDQTYELALKKGAKSVQAPKDEFYGDRVGAVKDVGGNSWWIATNKFIPSADCLAA